MNKPPLYVPPNEFIYTRSQIEWVLQYWTLDHWPRQASGYIDVPLDIQHQPSQAMPNRTWLEVKAEIDRRMGMCGNDGAMILLRCCYDMDWPELSRTFNLPATTVEANINRALNYISWGPKYPNPGPNIDPKKVCRTPRGTYREWCERRKDQTAAARTKRLASVL